ncbi:MAG: DUF2797 domain-containing protein, partial [Asgard group archaeon]|nr:DUF2797 domain-containing protein [Asgard group archaeon]
MKQFVFYFGWQGKDPYSPMLGLKSSHEEISEPTFLELKKGKPINIKISKNSQYYCRGYINKDGKRVLCPDNTQLPLKQNQCHECENRDFYNCRIFCRGDFCHPSSPEAKQYCWNKTAYVYLTAIAGKIKVGSSTNPRKRWIGQGSDIGIVIAQDVGLNPRALEQSIATRLKLPLAIRTSEKIKFLGNSSKIIKMTEKIQTILKKTYHAINSPIL